MTDFFNSLTLARVCWSRMSRLMARPGVMVPSTFIRWGLMSVPGSVGGGAQAARTHPISWATSAGCTPDEAI